MEDHEYTVMRLAEDHYWWYAGLHHLVLRNAYDLLKGIARPRVLDAGCGTGGAAFFLKSRIPSIDLLGIDPNPRAIELSLQRNTGGQLLYGSVEALPFDKESFDLVISLDVLYIRGIDDQAAMSEFRRVLKKKACLIVNLPAFELLRGEHDRAVHSGKRYVKSELQALFRRSSLETRSLTYWNTALFPFMALWRNFSHLRAKRGTPPRSDLRNVPELMNQILASYIKKEIELTRYLSLPFGSSIFGVAEKVE